MPGRGEWGCGERRCTTDTLSDGASLLCDGKMTGVEVVIADPEKLTRLCKYNPFDRGEGLHPSC